MYKTEIATPKELKIWDQMISRCPYSEALHTLEWRNALAASFKQLKPLYLIIKDGDHNIAGTLPCFMFRPVPLSRTLLSMPWTLPGGPLIYSDSDTADAVSSVCKKMHEISHGQNFYETTFILPPLCSADIGDILVSAGYLEKELHFTHILNIENGYDAVWKTYNKRVRGAVRKAEKTSVLVSETEDEADMMYFYKLYIAQMNRFGSTPKPFSLLRYLQTSSIARLVIAKLNDRIIGGLLFLYFNSCVRLWCETSDTDFLNYRPNNAIIDYIIRWACERNYRIVDFGASPPGNDGLINFKEEWGAKKERFSTFSKLYSPWRKKIWIVLEPSVRRVYAAIQRFKV